MMKTSVSKIFMTTVFLLVSVCAGATAQTSTRDGQSYGWTSQPEIVTADGVDRPLTELESLSLSSSGAGFAESLYNAVTDNPLIPVSVTLRALDKITAKYTDLTIDIGVTQDFGKLRILPRTCNKRPPEEIPETTAFLEIIDLDDLSRLKEAEEQARQDSLDAAEDGMSPEGAPGPASQQDLSASSEGVEEEEALEEKQAELLGEFSVVPALFRGWMFASSPALNSVEHPVYDVWVIDCKMVEPSE